MVYELEKLREIKEREKLSNEAICRELEISYTTLHRWFTGRHTPLPSMRRLIRIFIEAHAGTAPAAQKQTRQG